tara:strand:+ start:871 stop:1365 length:495 start_codon:yes stop_codon:yes gene_type:complete
MSKIIQDIQKLQSKYHNSQNQYKYREYVSEENFKKNMKIFLKQEWDDVKIVDGKYYYDNDTILEIFEDGTMNSYYIKKFKYIKYDNNCKLTLYNEKRIPLDDFFFKQNYNKILIMKKIILTRKKDRYEFNVSIDEKKNQNFIINFISSSSDISNFSKVLYDYKK